MKEKVKFAFHVLTHPFDGFWDLKREGRAVCCWRLFLSSCGFCPM